MSTQSDFQALQRGEIVEYRFQAHGGGVAVNWGRFSHWDTRNGQTIAWLKPRSGKRYGYGYNLVTPIPLDDLIAIRRPPRRARRRCMQSQAGA